MVKRVCIMNFTTICYQTWGFQLRFLHMVYSNHLLLLMVVCCVYSLSKYSLTCGIHFATTSCLTCMINIFLLVMAWYNTCANTETWSPTAQKLLLYESLTMLNTLVKKSCISTTKNLFLLSNIIRSGTKMLSDIPFLHNAIRSQEEQEINMSNFNLLCNI